MYFQHQIAKDLCYPNLKNIFLHNIMVMPVIDIILCCAVLCYIVIVSHSVLVGLF